MSRWPSWSSALAVLLYRHQGVVASGQKVGTPPTRVSREPGHRGGPVLLPRRPQAAGPPHTLLLHLWTMGRPATNLPMYLNLLVFPH